MKQAEGQIGMFDLDTAFGKTYPEPCPATTEKTSELSSKSSAGSKRQVLQFLDLTGGGWNAAGCIVGDDYSVAWRIMDAQFWGVPQRRRRIALVADFAGQSAPEILFKRPCGTRRFEQSGASGQAASEDSAGSPDGSG